MEKIKVKASIIDWDGISLCKLPYSFIDENVSRLNWKLLSNKKVSLDFLRRYKDYVDWDYASSNIQMDLSFISEHSEYVNWDLISRCQKLNEDFMKKYCDKINFHVISCYQKLSEDFIREFCDKLDWYYISVYQKYSYEFAWEFRDRLTKVGLLRQNYSSKQKEILRSYLDKIDLPLYGKINKEYNTNYESDMHFYNVLIENYSNNPSQFDNIIKSYHDEINWPILSSKWNLPKSFVIKYADDIKWVTYLSVVDEYDKDLLIQCINNKFVFSFLLKNELISFEELSVITN